MKPRLGERIHYTLSYDVLFEVIHTKGHYVCLNVSFLSNVFTANKKKIHERIKLPCMYLNVE